MFLPYLDQNIVNIKLHRWVVFKKKSQHIELFKNQIFLCFRHTRVVSNVLGIFDNLSQLSDVIAMGSKWKKSTWKWCFFLSNTHQRQNLIFTGFYHILVQKWNKQGKSLLFLWHYFHEKMIILVFFLKNWKVLVSVSKNIRNMPEQFIQHCFLRNI